MAPAATKRKRPERTNQNQGSDRPSPHRPQDLNLAQQSQNSGGGRGGRRVSRGGNRSASQAQQRSPSASSATAQRPGPGGLSSPTSKNPPSPAPSVKADTSAPLPNQPSQATPITSSFTNIPYYF